MVTVMVGLERVWEDTWEEEEEVVLARWQGPQPEEDHLDPEGFRPPSHRQKAMPCMSKVNCFPKLSYHFGQETNQNYEKGHDCKKCINALFHRAHS